MPTFLNNSLFASPIAESARRERARQVRRLWPISPPGCVVAWCMRFQHLLVLGNVWDTEYYQSASKL